MGDKCYGRPHIVMPNSVLSVPKEMFETPPARAFSNTLVSAGTTFSLSDPVGSRPRISKSFASAWNSRLTMCSVALISALQGLQMPFQPCAFPRQGMTTKEQIPSRRVVSAAKLHGILSR